MLCQNSRSNIHSIDSGISPALPSSTRRLIFIRCGRSTGGTLQRVVVVLTAAGTSWLRATEGSVASHHLAIWRLAIIAVNIHGLCWWLKSTYPAPNAADQAQTIPSREIFIPSPHTPSNTFRSAPLSTHPLSLPRNLKMFQMLKRTTGGWALLALHAHPPTSRTSRPAILPKLPQLLPNLAASTSPVTANAVPELRNMAPKIQLVLLQPAHVEFLAGGAALELARYVFFVVADDPVGICVRSNNDDVAGD